MADSDPQPRLRTVSIENLAEEIMEINATQMFMALAAGREAYRTIQKCSEKGCKDCAEFLEVW